jgi:hypothetical protein
MEAKKRSRSHARKNITPTETYPEYPHPVSNQEVGKGDATAAPETGGAGACVGVSGSSAMGEGEVSGKGGQGGKVRE